MRVAVERLSYTGADFESIGMEALSSKGISRCNYGNIQEFGCGNRK
jgi:hypothetical protein